MSEASKRHAVTALVVSFGYDHATAPDADMTLDLRDRFRNPHRDPAMRELTGLHEPVRGHVLHTPGIRTTIEAAARFATGMAGAGLDCVIAAGCVGGRHRSVAVAVEIGRALEDRGIPVRVVHRDIDRPVIQRTSGQTT